MKAKLKVTKSKRIKTIVCVLISLILTLLISIFLFVNNYIEKMNLVKPQAEETSLVTSTENVMELDPEQETKPEDQPVEEPEDDPSAPDSPEEDIAIVEDKIQKNMQENSIPILDDEDVFNILFIGSDTRKSGGNGRSDSMIAISINKKVKTITATSFMRDIYLQITGKSSNRINEAFSYGGADLLMDTIEQNFKMHINRYVAIDFFAFIDIVDSIGGVTLEVTEKDIPVINFYIMEINRLTAQEEAKDCFLSYYHYQSIKAMNCSN